MIMIIIIIIMHPRTRAPTHTPLTDSPTRPTHKRPFRSHADSFTQPPHSPPRASTDLNQHTPLTPLGHAPTRSLSHPLTHSLTQPCTRSSYFKHETAHEEQDPAHVCRGLHFSAASAFATRILSARDRRTHQS